MLAVIGTIVALSVAPTSDPFVKVSHTKTALCAVRASGTLWCSGWPTGSKQFATVKAANGVRDAWLNRSATDLELCWLDRGGTLTCIDKDGGPRTKVKGVKATSNNAWVTRAGKTYLCEDDCTDPKPFNIGFVPGWVGYTPNWSGSGCTVKPKDGSVHCWGYHLGYGRADTAGRVDTVRGAVEVATTGKTACARLRSGKVQCWGMSTGGQLGKAVPDDVDAGVVTVPNLDDAVALAAQQYTICALRKAGKVTCWGETGMMHDGSYKSGRVDLVRPGASSISVFADSLCVAAGQAISCYGPRSVLGKDGAEVSVGRSGMWKTMLIK